MKVFFAETLIGWIPCFMEQADDRYENLLPWVFEVYGWEKVKLLPSEYVKNHCSWSFMRDRVGVSMRHIPGVDNVIWATDFPHWETDFPNSMATVDRNFDGVPLDEVRKMASENVSKLFKLTSVLPSAAS